MELFADMYSFTGNMYCLHHDIYVLHIEKDIQYYYIWIMERERDIYVTAIFVSRVFKDGKCSWKKRFLGGFCSLNQSFFLLLVGESRQKFLFFVCYIVCCVCVWLLFFKEKLAVANIYIRR